MSYEYSGYLKTLLGAPDPALTDQLEAVEFSADDLAQWSLADDDAEREWQHIPSMIERTPDGVMLRGYFEDLRRIDYLEKDDPSFWVPLSSRNWGDRRLPVDLSRYPIAEITYRCRTPKARPAWMWEYPGGQHFDGLQPTRTWRTIARRIPHFGFPTQIDRLTLRLYSTSRSTEEVEIKSIRFRAASPDEQNVAETVDMPLLRDDVLPSYPLLDDYMPMGVYMNAGTAKRMADSMDISFHDYWRLALEDIARHHHNAVALEEIDLMSRKEWTEVLQLAESFGVRFLAVHDWCMEDFDENGARLVEKFIQPHAGSQAILAWAAGEEPAEHTFQAHLKARRLIAAADPSHPMAVIMRDPDSLPLFAPFFPVSAISHTKSHVAWQVGDMVRTHQQLTRGQHFWMMAPAFVYATDAPAWNTCPEMRLIGNLALANGVHGLFSYTYHNDPIWVGGHCQRSLTGPFLTFSDLWQELSHRMERFQTLSPLLLAAAPDLEPEIDFEVHFQPHRRSQCPPHVPVIRWYWLKGADYSLLYLVNNDIGEVTAVHLKVPDNLPKGLEVFDITNFVRNRSWIPMERQRHIEMFPGQGQMILVAPPSVCEKWRDVISERIMAGDRRQLAIDLDLAQRYHLDVAEVDRFAQSTQSQHPLQGLLRMRDARDNLLNIIYGAPSLIEPRSKIIEASAAICGCDGALCRLVGMGKSDLAHEMGLRVLPLTREMTNLRLRLREGQGMGIYEECASLAQRTEKLLTEIRALA
jgi:hypothetical protein